MELERGRVPADTGLGDKPGGEVYGEIDAGFTAITAEDAGDPVLILLPQRQVKPEAVKIRGERLWTLPRFIEERVAWDLMQEEEDDRRNQDRRDRNQDQTLPEIKQGSSHCSVMRSSGSLKGVAPATPLGARDLLVLKDLHIRPVVVVEGIAAGATHILVDQILLDAVNQVANDAVVNKDLVHRLVLVQSL